MPLPVVEVLSILGVCAAAFAIYAVVLFVIAFGRQPLEHWIRQRRERKRARIEAELDRTQAELRQTILQIASALGGDALEARKALIRESYLARGEVPKE
ncbi:hypothetical protein IFU08_12410 [Microbacterium sp. CFBP 8790]|uniref:hypothetical protein n=1 Tax=unclassified Microbacterium TaxID=2609290 RepID=UPI001781E433|nr:MULTISPECIES: hypothetical protein [unclassified Microbacterium]MBD8207792.1 hypothetical protein [Microbacterium sp. CFBP 8801]MBD8510360.1 hypothetical protein [Microbacterium sp. CFBP 8790]